MISELERDLKCWECRNRKWLGRVWTARWSEHLCGVHCLECSMYIMCGKRLRVHRKSHQTMMTRVNYHQSQQWKGGVMTCLVHLTVLEICVKPGVFFKNYSLNIAVDWLGNLYDKEWCMKHHLWLSNEDGLWPRSGLWTPLHRVMLPQARSSSGLNILLWVSLD